MFKQAGLGLFIFCDDETKSLRVATDTPLVSGFKGTFREIASFRSEREWLASSYSSQVTDELVLDMIDWFWMDLEREVTQDQNLKRFRCRWCDEVFESEFGLFCTHCGRFQTNTANPKPPEPLKET